ncbi:MAG: YkgJ family cysteine cluster protein [Thermodesulfobacteriota bacterium]|nr:YkgJ family cysteine cluster protein [Thermodesulfobacteriota bacterium]
MPGPLKAFECQQCGHCCKGSGGIVMTKKDVARLSRHLNLSWDEFLSRHTTTKNNKVLLRSGPDGYCVFYKDGCGVHLARPDICRAWPFFRGNLIDETSWEMALDYCPGINKEAGHAEFKRQGLAYLKGQGIDAEGSDDAPQALLNLPE